MITPPTRREWLLQSAALLATPALARARADDPPPKTLVLFDGKSLEGWKPTPFHKAGPVEVVDGAILLRAGDPMTGITTTREDLPRSNYELVYEAKRVDGDDFFAAATFPVGKSYISLVNGGWGGTVTGLSSLNGADASENETTQAVSYKKDTWYRFRVHVTDKVIRAWLDKTLIIAVVHADVEVKTRLEVRANQPLGFASYGTTGAIRKVEIRPLSPAEIAQANSAEP
jgi:hypothetical protein